MEKDLNESGDLPQPGTEEPEESTSGDAGSGPGNVSVDEPTAGALDDPIADDASDEDDDDTDDSTTGDEG